MSNIKGFDLVFIVGIFRWTTLFLLYLGHINYLWIIIFVKIIATYIYTTYKYEL